MRDGRIVRLTRCGTHGSRMRWRLALVACGALSAASSVQAGTNPGSVRPVAWGFAVAFGLGSLLIAVHRYGWGARIVGAAALVDLAGQLYAFVLGRLEELGVLAAALDVVILALMWAPSAESEPFRRRGR